MAAASARGHRLEVATRDRSVGDLMRPIFEAVPAGTTVATAIDLYQVGPRMRTQAVEDGGRVVGILGQVEIDAVEPGQRDSTRVGAAMTRIGPGDVLESTTPLLKALQRPAGSTRHIIVTIDNRVVGLIGAPEVGELLRSAG
jgi:hypothetical protein